MHIGRRLLCLTLAMASITCGGGKKPAAPPRPEKLDAWTEEFLLEFSREPDTVPTRWHAIIGEYGADTAKRWFVLERDKRIWVMDQYKYYVPLTERSDSVFQAPTAPVPVQGEVRFHFDSTHTAASVQVGDVTMPRRRIEPAAGVEQMRITPVRPLDELRREALAATPPAESGKFDATDLVDVTKLDSTIKIDVRYASENNFLGTRMYDTERVFMQKAAAAALVRANKTMRRLNGRLIIHDGYRPWYVTKIFWDATPEAQRWLVANPQQGSRHNRGIAVDLNIYDDDLKRATEMPSTYDEATERAFSTYPGGTSRERWHRALLRRVMEHEGFAVNPKEWWHFDYVDRKRYAIGNIPFDKIGAPTPPAPAGKSAPKTR
jgi:D-alanyl-D-alanine dipeptidase